MARDQEFAWTGPLPDQGYVGYVNIRVTDAGVVFTVRAEGSGERSSYTLPHDVAAKLLRGASEALAG